MCRPAAGMRGFSSFKGRCLHFYRDKTFHTIRGVTDGHHFAQAASRREGRGAIQLLENRPIEIIENTTPNTHYRGRAMIVTKCGPYRATRTFGLVGFSEMGLPPAPAVVWFCHGSRASRGAGAGGRGWGWPAEFHKVWEFMTCPARKAPSPRTPFGGPPRSAAVPRRPIRSIAPLPWGSASTSRPRASPMPNNWKNDLALFVFLLAVIIGLIFYYAP